MNKLANSNNTMPEEFIRSVLAPFGCPLSVGMVDSIGSYIQLLQRWNRRISLTSLKNTKDILERHFGESLLAVHAVPILHGRLADVGSGAGFPGLPIKIASPQVDMVLIESNARKAAFLSEVIRSLGLISIRVINKRMEDIDSLRGSLDFVVARALGNIAALLKWSRSSLRQSGRIVLWLGRKDSTEVSATSGWTWRTAILIPRSERRFLLVGERNP